MINRIDNVPASLSFDGLDYADNEENAESPYQMAICVSKGKSRFPQNSALKNLSTDCRLMWAFLMDAVCKYGRDNQPNDASGTDTRTSAGVNGGRIIEPAREQLRVLSHSFKPKFESCNKSVIAIATDGSVEDT